MTVDRTITIKATPRNGLYVITCSHCTDVPGPDPAISMITNWAIHHLERVHDAQSIDIQRVPTGRIIAGTTP